jgi:hypothetical protein
MVIQRVLGLMVRVIRQETRQDRRIRGYPALGRLGNVEFGWEIINIGHISDLYCISDCAINCRVRAN